MKAVLVLDEMPESCEDCPLENKMYISCIVMCRRTSKFKESKPDWCPLRPMPARYDKQDTIPDYRRGWNDCLDEIDG